MQRTLSREVRDEQGGTSQPQPARKDGGGSSLVQHWKAKAHKLADMVFRQEIQKRELQKEVAVLKDAQNLSETAYDLAKLRSELLSAKDKLLGQAQELAQREDLLKQAAGAARKETLKLQEINSGLRSQVDRLLKENKELTAKFKSATSTPPKFTGKENGGPMYISPAKTPHMDMTTLQSMLRQRDDELRVLREDNAAKQEELLHSLQSLQAAQKRGEDLRCQTVSLNIQIEIMREALRQRDGDVDAILGDMEQLKSLQDALDAREMECTRMHEVIAESAQQLALMRNELGASMDEASVLHSTLREREVQVQELQAKAEDLQSRLSAVEEQLEQDDTLASSRRATALLHRFEIVDKTGEPATTEGSDEATGTGFDVDGPAGDGGLKEQTAESPVRSGKPAHRGKAAANVFVKTVVIARLAVAIACMLEWLR